jgi:hypothetical protein
LGLVNSIAATFFPWKNPTFALGDAAFWITATLTVLFGIPGGLLSEVGKSVLSGANAFVAAGVSQASHSLQPE